MAEGLPRAMSTIEEQHEANSPAIGGHVNLAYQPNDGDMAVNVVRIDTSPSMTENHASFEVGSPTVENSDVQFYYPGQPPSAQQQAFYEQQGELQPQYDQSYGLSWQQHVASQYAANYRQNDSAFGDASSFPNGSVMYITPQQHAQMQQQQQFIPSTVFMGQVPMYIDNNGNPRSISPNRGGSQQMLDRGGRMSIRRRSLSADGSPGGARKQSSSSHQLYQRQYSLSAERPARQAGHPVQTRPLSANATPVFRKKPTLAQLQQHTRLAASVHGNRRRKTSAPVKSMTMFNLHAPTKKTSMIEISPSRKTSGALLRGNSMKVSAMSLVSLPEIQITDPLGRPRRRHSSTPSLQSSADVLDGIMSNGTGSAGSSKHYGQQEYMQDGSFGMPFGRPASRIPQSVSAPQNLSKTVENQEYQQQMAAMNGRTIELANGAVAQQRVALPVGNPGNLQGGGAAGGGHDNLAYVPGTGVSAHHHVVTVPGVGRPHVLHHSVSVSDFHRISDEEHNYRGFPPLLRQLHSGNDAIRPRSISVTHMSAAAAAAASPIPTVAGFGIGPGGTAVGFSPQQVVAVHPYRSAQGSPQNSTGGLAPSANGSQQFTAILNIPRSPTIDSVSVRSYGPALPPSTTETFKNKAFRETLQRVLSWIYALFILMVGIVVYIADNFMEREVSLAEVFSIYLSVFGIIFLAFLHADIRNYQTKMNKKAEDEEREYEEDSGKLNYGALVGYSDDDMAPDSISVAGDHHQQQQQQQQPTYLGTINVIPQQSAHAASTASPMSAHTEEESGETKERGYWFLSGRHSGQIYLKAGTAAFCLGHIIHEGLLLGRQILYFSSKDEEVFNNCANVATILLDIIHPIYVFYQLVFVFKYSNIVIERYKAVARFGLMHCISSSICFWLWSIIRETVDSIHTSYATNSEAYANPALKAGLSSGYSQVMKYVPIINTLSAGMQPPFGEAPITAMPITAAAKKQDPLLQILNGTLLGGSKEICYKTDELSGLINQMSPYLYPFSIEFNILMVGVWFVMWQHIGRDYHSDADGQWARDMDPMAGLTSQKKHQQSTTLVIDCHSANRGMFVGLLVLATTIISVIIFFLAFTKDEYTSLGVWVNAGYEFALSSVMILAAAMAYKQVIRLDVLKHSHSGLDEFLLFVAIPCFFLFGIFSSLPALNAGLYFFVCVSIMQVLQVVIQTPMIIEGLRRCSNSSTNRSEKPGRELITFLIVCNICMWVLETFEIKSYEAQADKKDYYGKVAWTLLSHSTLPLCLFYRFHSSVCLVDIWKQAYEPGDSEAGDGQSGGHHGGSVKHHHDDVMSHTMHLAPSSGSGFSAPMK